MTFFMFNHFYNVRSNEVVKLVIGCVLLLFDVAVFHEL